MGAAFGLGVVIGAMLTFRAGMYYDRWRQAQLVADEYLGGARKLRGRAGSAVAVLLLVLAGGIMFMMFS